MPIWLYFDTAPTILNMINGETITVPGSSMRRVPPGVVNLAIEIWGAGASNGGFIDNIINGFGGCGSGGYSKRNSKAVTPSDLISYTVGLASTNSGIVTDSICDGMTAKGGITGGPLFLGAGGAGGPGGTSSGGDVNITGNSGGNTTVSSPGNGGNAPNGGTGGAGVLNGDANPGLAPGGGAGGYSQNDGNTYFGALGGNGGVRFSWTEELLDSFETWLGGQPVNGSPRFQSWSSASIISQSTDHVTNGTYSCRVQGSSSPLLDLDNIGFTPIDLSEYASLGVDVFVSSLGGDSVRLAVGDEDFNFANSATINTTGAHTLTVNLSGLDTTRINMIRFESDSIGSVDIYIDKFYGVLI